MLIVTWMGTRRLLRGIALIVVGTNCGATAHDGSGMADAGATQDGEFGGGGSAGSAGAATAGISGVAGGSGATGGVCDFGKGAGGAFYNPESVGCEGYTPLVVDKHAKAEHLPACTGATPLCSVEQCTDETAPEYCCKEKTVTCRACPLTSGAAMISAGNVCIDSSEVTRGEYESWLLQAPPIAAQTPRCAWNTSFEPDAACMSQSCIGPGCSAHPQVCVDWCDARAYCAAVGKRLCWAQERAVACGELFTGIGSYPYGDTYSESSCNGADAGVGQTAPVATFPACASELAEGTAFDLSGNAAEWVDSCQGTAGASDTCSAAGGAFDSLELALRCSAVESLRRDSTKATVGFRCCAP
jgi:formylglycine-generating enzyme